MIELDRDSQYRCLQKSMEHVEEVEKLKKFPKGKYLNV